MRTIQDQPVITFDDRTQLERHLDDTGHPQENPGRRLAAAMRKRQLEEPSGSSKERKTLSAEMASYAELREAVETYDDFVAFMADRIPTGAKTVQTKYARSKQLEKRGKLLRYDNLDDPQKSLLDDSRRVEWSRYLKYNAVTVVSRAEGQRLISEENAEALPMQWIEVDKNEKERTEDNPLPPDMRSRMVARGDLEKVMKRTDSPTVSEEGILIICSWCASLRIFIRSADMESGYFQGVKLDYILVLFQPKGGVPDPSVKPDDMFLANVPIYGTTAAGRGLYFRVRTLLIENGLKENFVIPALYSFSRDGIILIMVGTHVDDLLYGYVEEMADLMKHILDQVILGRDTTHSFRFCGREFVQDAHSFDITMTCDKTTTKMEPIRIAASRAAQQEADATPQEISQLRSIVGSESWVVRSCRPDYLFDVSTLQQVMNKAKVSDLLDAIRLAKDLQNTSKRGLTFRSGIDWYKSIMIVVGDSSFGNETQWIDEWQEVEPYRSQGGKLLCLGEPPIADNQPGMLHVLSAGSSIVRRVCRSTVQAEAYNLDLCVEEADLLRAAIIDLRGLLDHRDWEVSASSQMHSAWFTDCRSVSDALCRNVLSNIADKRLGITLAAMRQSLWRTPGGGLTIPRMLERRPVETTDSVTWIDTSIMPCDCLTKKMKPDYLQKFLDTNYWDPRQTAEAKEQKATRQQQRKKKPVSASPA